MARFNLQDIRNAESHIDPIFLHTPQFESEPLGASLSCQTILKVETVNPLRSFKGRGAELLLSRTNDHQLLCASAGNFGQAMAYACRKKSVKLTVFASVHANPLKLERMRQLGAEVILRGDDFDAAKEFARAEAVRTNTRFVEDSRDVETVIGAGTIGLELVQSYSNLDYVLVPLGNGALVNGIGTVLKELSPRTKVVAVQSAGAPAMVESWHSSRLIRHDRINTIADGIGVRIPVVEALDDMKATIDNAIAVREETILKAMQLILLHTALAVEPSAAVGVAALMEKPELFRGKKVALIITGSNLTAQQLKDWF